MKIQLYITIFFISIISTFATAPKVNLNWNKEVFYFTLLDRFRDGEPSNNLNVDKSNIMAYHGGDLKGITRKMDYFEQLGTTGLIFTPLLDNRDKDFFGHWALHGYWPINHLKLDEHWGDFKDLSAFNRAKATHHQSFLVDIVLNHVAWDHPWLKSKKSWFNTLGPIQDWSNQDQLERGQVTGLPDLNQDIPEVYDYLLEYTKFWIVKTQAQGIRLDAIKHIAHRFWKKFLKDINKYVKEKHNRDDFLLLGELLHGDPKAYTSYVEDGFNSFYNYPLYYSIKDVVADRKSFYHLAARWQELDRTFERNITWVNFIDNHDLARFKSLNDKVEKEHILQALSMAFFYPGIPFLYYGTEELMEGGNGEEGRKSLDFKRIPIFEEIKELIRLRKEYADYLTEEREDLLVDRDAYGVRYQGSAGDLVVFFHRVGEKKHWSIPIGVKDQNITSLLDGGSQKYPLKKGSIEYIASDRGFDLFFIKKERLKVSNPLAKKEVNLKISLKAEAGKELFLVGNLNSIGSWNPKDALKLNEISPGAYQVEENFSAEQILSFKFIQKKGSQVVWEDRVDNRFIFPKENTTLSYRWNTDDSSLN